MHDLRDRIHLSIDYLLAQLSKWDELKRYERATEIDIEGYEGDHHVVVRIQMDVGDDEQTVD